MYAITLSPTAHLVIIHLSGTLHRDEISACMTELTRTPGYSPTLSTA